MNKRKIRLAKIFFLALPLCIVLLGAGCDTQEDISVDKPKAEELSAGDPYRGKMAGYIKCYDRKRENILLGIFIISTEDSLVSFNIPSSLHNLDINELPFGLYRHNMRLDSVTFDYRNPELTELIQIEPPAQSANLPSFPFPYSIFSQVIITSIHKIE